ncbi:hypothetical protein FDG2_3358 [Candidatus Protofrankia californiensis]|uniref:NADAR domain-containing protein n=1 Tax=Candidatus Protofrankia californiensis TaxID=1839754 RepID=A0A1C3NZG4_9ACTN|nr:hypothetical protein FDG2_3358 [Candidatus Protofrankia californiensis]
MAARDDAIRFHRLTDEYGCFTNFARYPVLLDGLVWPTSEHYFQSRKFTDQAHVERIRLATTPSQAARLGQTRATPLRRDWGKAREEVMRHVVRAKFLQHPPLAARLVGTGNRLLVEDTRGDHFWGDGGDGTGQNVNGHILMDLRAELREPDDVVTQVMARLDGWPNYRPWVLFDDAVVVVPTRPSSKRLVSVAASLLRTAAESPAITKLRPGEPFMVDGVGTLAVGADDAPLRRVRAAAKRLDVRRACAPAVG